jgi:hypothetical protein
MRAVFLPDGVGINLSNPQSLGVYAQQKNENTPINIRLLVLRRPYEKWSETVDTRNKQHKKIRVEGQLRAETPFSDGPTKTEPRRRLLALLPITYIESARA